MFWDRINLTFQLRKFHILKEISNFSYIVYICNIYSNRCLILGESVKATILKLWIGVIMHLFAFEEGSTTGYCPWSNKYYFVLLMEVSTFELV